MPQLFCALFVIVLIFSSCSGEGNGSPEVGMDTTTSDSFSSDLRTKNDMGSADFSTVDVVIDPNEKFLSRALESTIDSVQPMTGIVLWEDSWNDGNTKDDIQIEYSYFPPNEIVKGKGVYDWSSFEAFLDRVAARGNQAMPRFYYAYVGRQTVVPDYIKDLDGYSESQGNSEGQRTWFPDWRNEELQNATIDFLTEFAKRYDGDPRIAFLQVGFGLWGEYHIYEGPNELGKDFPSYAFQKRFIEHLDSELKTLKWNISIDAGNGNLSAFPNDSGLNNAGFGVFDDSFMHERHSEENEPNWEFFEYQTRHLTAPHGGEFSYFTNFDQRNVLNPDGLHGNTFEGDSKRFYISYMIGNDQPDYSFKDRIKEAGMATGYKFQITTFESSDKNTRVEIKNNGVAPIYYDAFPSIGDVRSQTTLKGLGPGESKVFLVGRAEGELSISSDHLVPGQVIQFDADLSE